MERQTLGTIITSNNCSAIDNNAYGWINSDQLQVPTIGITALTITA